MIATDTPTQATVALVDIFAAGDRALGHRSEH